MALLEQNLERNSLMNNDLVLREHLAIERTKLANERTLLTYIRTGLYFIIAGATVGHLLKISFWIMMEFPMIALGLVIIGFGMVRYVNVRKVVKNSVQNIGRATNDFINSVKEII